MYFLIKSTSPQKREKEKWASSSESFSLVFEKRPLLAGKFRPFSLPHPAYSFPARFSLRPPHHLVPVVKKVDIAVHWKAQMLFLNTNLSAGLSNV